MKRIEKGQYAAYQTELDSLINQSVSVSNCCNIHVFFNKKKDYKKLSLKWSKS